MAKKKASKPRGARAARAAAPKATPTPLPAPTPACSKTFEFFKDVTVGPGQNHDSTTAKNVDCYQWLHVWVLAKHAANMAMDNISVELVFELTGQDGRHRPRQPRDSLRGRTCARLRSR